MRFDELELSAPAALVLSRSTAADAVPIARRSATVLRVYGFPIVLGAILVVGTLLRIRLPAGFNGIGFDENLYRTYVGMLDRCGVRHYPVLINSFISHQLDPGHYAILPPTRVFYIIGGYAYHHLFGLEPLRALRMLSCQFSVLTLFVSALAVWRMTGQRALTIAVTALMACAATEIHLAQHSLIDGVFGFWALLVVWLMWENLRHPGKWSWSIALGSALAVMVVTKENAFFVFAVLLLMMLGNHWLKFGTVTRRLILTVFVGALAGFTVVLMAAGGIENFTLVFSLLKEKVPTLPYTIHTGGGPWHRYLVDLLLVSPVVVLLATANILQTVADRTPAHRYLATFSCLTYAVLTVFPEGMNLRYILMLDMPLRFFATQQVFAFSQYFGRHKNVLLACTVLAICAYDLRQHHILFVKGQLYELVTEGLVRTQGIIR